MNSFSQAYAEWLHEVHVEILNDLETLPPEALDWTPGHEMNSVSVLIVHLTGAERFFIDDIIMGDPSNRNRDTEFLVKGIKKQDLVLRLNETESYIHKALESLSEDDLKKERVDPRYGIKMTVAEALLHTLEHSSLHAGHIQITAQLWHQRKVGET
jgi:uncharacterized damage-inducible protein DinB